MLWPLAFWQLSQSRRCIDFKRHCINLWLKRSFSILSIFMQGQNHSNAFPIQQDFLANDTVCLFFTLFVVSVSLPGVHTFTVIFNKYAHPQMCSRSFRVYIQSKWVFLGHKCLLLYYYCYYHSSQARLCALVESEVKVVLFPLEAVICVQQRPIPTDDIALPFNSPPQSMQESVIIH